MLRLEHLPISETRLVALGRGGGVLQSRARRLLRWNGDRLLFERFVLPGDSGRCGGLGGRVRRPGGARHERERQHHSHEQGK